jgi:hypothetical protein
MDNWEEAEEKNPWEVTEKGKKEYNRHALRLLLFFIGLILSVIIFIQCGSNPNWPIEVFDKICRYVTPHSTLQFKKVNSCRPNNHMTTIKGYAADHHQSPAITYDVKKSMFTTHLHNQTCLLNIQ